MLHLFFGVHAYESEGGQAAQKMTYHFKFKETKMKSSILGKLRLALVATTLAVTLGATVTLCLAQEQSQNEVASNGKIIQPHSDGAVLNRSERGLLEPDSLNQDPLLIAQAGGLWCYTDFGRYPMLILAPVGSVCSVRVNFYPWVLQGTVGY